jgi:hypothetical protein
MSFGIQILTDYNQLIDTSTFPCSIYEIFTVSGGSSGTKNYPELAGFTIYAGIDKIGFADPKTQSGVSINYSSGYPQLNWAPVSSSAPAGTNTILVIIK